MDDRETGISIRFIREFKPDPGIVTEMDQAIILAMQDERDVSDLEKILTALTFLRQRKN